MSDPESEEDTRPPSNFGEIEYNDLGGDSYDQCVANHDRRVEVLATALERFIGLMGVPLDCNDSTGDILAECEDAAEDIRKVIRVAARDLADSLTDIEDRFELGFEPESGEPLPPAFIAFLWLRSLSYSILVRAGYVDTPVSLPDGRYVHRQLPPEWPSIEDLLERIDHDASGDPFIRPSPFGDLSEKEILATPEELRALRSCLTLLRLNSAKSISLPSAPQYESRRVPPKTDVPKTLGEIVPKNIKPTPVPGYLGLIVDDAECEIGRTGLSVTVGLKNKRLSWGVFQKLLKGTDTYCHMDQLKIVWETHGREDNPLSSCVYVQIRALKKLIESLNITIDNIPDRGYRLLDRTLSTDPSADAGLSSP